MSGVAPVGVSGKQRGRGRLRYLWPLLAGLLMGLGWVMVGTAVRPLQQTCDPVLSAGACSETIVAALKKGMPRPHPMLLSAHAAPGPQAGNDELGHRATVTFDALGTPGQITVDLYVDMGAHWGGVVDPGGDTVVLWSIAQGGLLAALIAGIGCWLIYRRDVRPSAGGRTER